MITADEVLKVARGEVGYRESAGNRNRYGAWYGMDGQPWCAMFVSWCAAQAGATLIIPKHAYTPEGVRWFRSRDRYGKRPRPGAVVYFYNASMGRVAHVGLVEAVHDDGSVTTIEGNTNTSGSRQGIGVFRLRRRSSIDGFGYPAYDGDSSSTSVSSAPAAPVVHWKRLRYDQRSSDSVRCLQRELNDVVAAGLPVTGNYLDRTKAAVAEFQRRQGWAGEDADGQIFPGGKETTRLLFEGRGYRVVW